MTNVVVARKRLVRVSTEATGGIIDSTTPVILKNNTTLNGSGGVDRLDHLKDVIASNEVEGATLVYDAGNDKYIVKQLDLADVTGVLDGGTF
jgi:hypothetical protein